MGALMMLVVFVPTVVFYIGPATSLALGAVLTAAFIVVIVAAYPLILKSPLARSTTIAVTVMLMLLLHLFGAATLRTVDFGHALASFVPLLAIALGGVAFGVALDAAASMRVDGAIRRAFGALCVVAVLPLIGLDVATILPGRGYARPFFPFTEPSHLALTILPLYFYVCVVAAPARRLSWLGFGLALVLLLQSLTLGAGWLIIALVCTRGLVLPVVIAACVGGLVAITDISYFTERLDFSDANQNLSTLVYLQGWELAGEALTTTHWWGQGFQQLGLLGSNSPTSRAIYALAGSDLNILDGGFTVAKLVGELGIAGVAVVVALVAAIVRSVIALRAMVRSPAHHAPALVFAHAVFASYLVELFVRGTGYFTGSALLLVAGAWLRIRAERAHVPSAGQFAVAQ